MINKKNREIYGVRLNEHTFPESKWEPVKIKPGNSFKPENYIAEAIEEEENDPDNGRVIGVNLKRHDVGVTSKEKGVKTVDQIFDEIEKLDNANEPL